MKFLKRRNFGRLVQIADRARDARNWPAASVIAEPLARADAARDAGQFTLAAQLYQEVLRDNPPSPHILVQLGNALKEIGSYGAAEDAYQQALELRPDDADCHLQLGHLLKLSGQPQRAMANYARSDALDPKRPDARRELHALASDPTFAGVLQRHKQIPENI